MFATNKNKIKEERHDDNRQSDPTNKIIFCLLFLTFSKLKWYLYLLINFVMMKTTKNVT